MSGIQRVILIVLDSVGCGDAPDAKEFGDEGSNTLAHTAQAVGGLKLPNLGQLGLGNITPIQGVPPVETPLGAYGRLTELSAGKDTTTGHWKLMGTPLSRPFPTYPDGFPADLVAEYERLIGHQVLGNYPASGTVIIQEWGAEHMRTVSPLSTPAPTASFR